MTLLMLYDTVNDVGKNIYKYRNTIYLNEGVK